MNGFTKWQISSLLSTVAVNLQGIYNSDPEHVKSPLLVGSGWSYKEWAYFNASRYAWQEDPAALGHLVKLTGSDFRDFLLAFSIRVYAPARAAAFASPSSLGALLRIVAAVVLKNVPQEFITADWVQQCEAKGTEPLVRVLA